MSDDQPDDAVANPLDAFMHPPQLHSVGHRAESADGQILIISHVELWPWRIVIRGTRASKSVRPHRDFAQPGPSGDQIPGTLRGAVRKPSPEEFEKQRTEAAWFTAWHISDNVGTTYHAHGSHRSGNEAWRDYAIQFEPPAPATARRLMIQTGDGDTIDLTLGTHCAASCSSPLS